jgi:radical SAM protein with 4Fe4S-binding SPASM domain
VLGNGWLGALPRLKNKLVTRIQQRVLGAFAWLSRRRLGDRLAARLARRAVGGYLYALKVELNTACNLACPMCYVERSGIELPFELIAGLFRDLAGCGVRVELLGGEPLLRRDIVDVVRGAKHVARAPLVSLYTNGVLVTPELATELRSAGLDAALVTLVSHDPATHDGFVGRPGAWAATVAGLRALRDAGLATYTFTAVHSVNQLHYREVDRFAREQLGVHALFYQYIPRRPDDPLTIGREAWRAIKRWVLYEASRDHGDFVRDFYMLTGNACSGGNFVLTVKASGIVQPCPFIDDIPLGDLRQRDIWAIHRHRYASADLCEFKTTPAECRDCTYASVCAGGCRAGHRRLFGSYALPDFRCLGPHADALDRDCVCDRVPSFF